MIDLYLDLSSCRDSHTGIVNNLTTFVLGGSHAQLKKAVRKFTGTDLITGSDRNGLIFSVLPTDIFLDISETICMC